MATQNPNNTLKYWHDGNSSTIIKYRLITVGEQNYWYNGKSSGFLGSINKRKPRAFAVLIGF